VLEYKLAGLRLFVLISFGTIMILSGLNYAMAFNVGAAGDWGCNSNTQSTVSNIKNQGPERVYALGDYSYQSTATCWLNIISSIKSITRISIGNHEDDSDEGFSQYMSAFGLSRTFYSLQYPNENLNVIIMDSDHSSYSTGSSQYNFVLGELQKPLKWKIVYLHKQMYTSPNTCSSGSCSNTGSDATNLRNIYHKWFDQYGVDVVLDGHVHNYQRTFPIRYDSGSPSSPIITSTSSTDYTDPTGEIFALVGTGGVNFHGLSGKSSFVKYQQDDRFGALDVSIENNGDTLAGRYYTNDGVKRDTFKIHKSYSGQYSYGPSLTLSGP
jgi:Calcineurin-like phosphoesterase